MLRVKIGEGSGVVLIFFLWLLVGLVLSVHVSYAVGFLYILISFVISLIFQPSIREIREVVLMSGDTHAPEEKRYSAGWVSIVVLRGPVKITARRIAILLAVIGTGLAILLLLMALGSPDGKVTSLTAISIGILLLLVVINSLEVRWRKADALKSNPRNTTQ
jgi:multisubunit Na+/H+ antiporter MnhB subunit